MRTLWRLLLSDRVKSSSHDPVLYRWQGRFKREQLTATLRLELRELLAPKVTLRKLFRWGEGEASAKQSHALAAAGGLGTGAGCR